jgi:YidC/Oxa1 family membrane protein insertase
MERRIVLITVIATLAGALWLTVLRSQSGALASEGSPEPAAAAVASPSAPSKDPGTGGATGALPEIVELEAPGHVALGVSSHGGGLAFARLLNPQYDRAPDAEVSPVPPPHKSQPGPLDLVTTWDAVFHPYTLEFTKLEAAEPVKWVDGTSTPLAQAWTPDAPFAVVSKSDTEVVLVWPDPNKADSPLYVERRYQTRGNYFAQAEVILHGQSTAPVTAQFDLVISGWQDPNASTGSLFSPPADVVSGACAAGGSYAYETFHDLVDEPETPAGAVSWAGVASHYFVVAAVPNGDGNTQCSLRGVQGGLVSARIHQTQPTVVGGVGQPCAPDWLPPSRRKGPACSELYAMLGAKPGMSPKELAQAKGEAVAAAMQEPERRAKIEQAYESLLQAGRNRWTYGIYTGPKDIDALKEAGSELSDALDFGTLSFLAVPMLYFLRWAEGMLGFWALAIVLLTILVKLVTLPLTQKSFKQMKAMKALQPEVERLREKYKDDRQKMNVEMMALYKARGANPLGGCLPMLLQMPIYIALYQTIYSAVDLYQAPLFGWITNMTAADPYFVLPLVLGVLMFVQQKLTPTTGDSQQAKIMLVVMPIMFTGMMLFLPAGLVLYILVNTLLGIGHQWWVYNQGT